MRRTLLGKYTSCDELDILVPRSSKASCHLPRPEVPAHRSYTQVFTEAPKPVTSAWLGAIILRQSQRLTRWQRTLMVGGFGLVTSTPELLFDTGLAGRLVLSRWLETRLTAHGIPISSSSLGGSAPHRTPSKQFQHVAPKSNHVWSF